MPSVRRRVLAVPAVRRAIRVLHARVLGGGAVIGRRNHFGSKSARGTEVAATLYSLVESAKATGIDPIAYLTEVATRAKESPGAVLLPADFGAQLAAA